MQDLMNKSLNDKHAQHHPWQVQWKKNRYGCFGENYKEKQLCPVNIHSISKPR